MPLQSDLRFSSASAGAALLAIEPSMPVPIRTIRAALPKLRELLATVAVIGAMAACKTAGVGGPTGLPSPASGGAGMRPVPSAPAGLPPVPAIKGAPIVAHVQYPADNQLITSRDSNFVLGSVGSGDAHLSINGIEVPLAPNGAYRCRQRSQY